MSTPRIIVVTGGAQNIGAAIAARFVQAGDTVICADLRAPDTDQIRFLATDVSSEDGVSALMTSIAGDYGYVDVLVNNAGICIEKPIPETTSEEWDRIMAVNVRSTFLMTKHVLPLMLEAQSRAPAIVNISSIEGIGANPLHSAYAASKAAVAAFTHNTALEYGVHGIRCNAIAPGWINTPFNEQLLAQYPDRAVVDAAIEALHPIGRLGTTSDVAETAFWLASPASGFITGQEIIVDGGRLARLPLPAL